MPIPIVIGVTGHRDLREKDIPQLRALVRTELQRLKTEYPHSPFVMLNSLAAGADLLCAEVANELGIMLKCPLPMSVEEYRKDFDADTVMNFKTMLDRADEVFIVPNIEPLPDKASHDYHYRQAGIFVATHSHVLLALWDGSPAKADGCGTAEAVGFMLNGDYKNGGSFQAANDGAVLHISTPRQSFNTEITILVRLIEKQPGLLHDVLRMTDAFNKEAIELFSDSESGEALLPDKYINDSEKLKCLNALYSKADALSLRFQMRYIRAIRWFSMFGVLLVLLFLLYDEFESDIFLLCYGLLIIIYLQSFVMTQKSKVHIKYLQYRVLSETLRVQFYILATGSCKNIGTAFTWTQKQDSTWVKEAMSALLIGTQDIPNIPDEIIKKYWIDGQLEYHKKALKRDKRRHQTNENIAKGMLICSILLFVIVLTMEFLFDSTITKQIITNPLPGFFLHHNGQVITLRSLLKMVLGGISAITVFISGYYGKLSFERKSFDHEKMVLLYSAANSQFDNEYFDRTKLFLELAREEIIENGNWFSYCRENPPSFNV